MSFGSREFYAATKIKLFEGHSDVGHPSVEIMLFWIHDAGGAGRCVLHLLGDTRLSAGFNPVYNRFPSIDGIHCHRSTLCRGRADSRCFRDTNGGVACRPNCVPF
jgi:hypothetical protein